MLASPTFRDKGGYFPERNIDTVFLSLNQGLKTIRDQLGEENYQTLIAQSEQMRAHFEADPEDKTDDTLKGRQIILEMENLLTEIWRKQSKGNSA